MDEKKVLHIALVGGQPMPLYLAIVDSKAEKFMLIHSSTTAVSARKLSTDISGKMGLPVELLEFDPLDFFAAKDRFEKLLEEYADWRIEANISGGTKPWSTAMTVLSERYANVELIYVDQNSRVYNYRTAECKEVDLLEIEDIFQYNQTEVKTHTSLADYTQEDLELLPRIKEIRKNYPVAFNKVTIPNKSNRGKFTNKEDSYIDPESGSEIIWDKKHLKGGDTVQYVKLTFGGKAGRSEEFISPHAFDMVTSSGWFEYEVATILKKWPSCKDVWLNVIFPYSNKSPKNEIDIIVGIGTKLLFVECKIQVFDRTDIDKFSAAVKNYGGSGAKAIFITQQYMGEPAEEKCRTNGIACFSFNDENKKLVSHKTLFDKLNKIAQTSNAR